MRRGTVLLIPVLRRMRLGLLCVVVIYMTDWLASVVALFGKVLSAVCDVPTLAFFLDFAVFVLIFSLLAWLVHSGMKGRL